MSLAVVCVLTAACSGPESELRVEEVRTVPAPFKPVAAGADTVTRFSATEAALEAVPTPAPAAAPPPEAFEIPLRWVVPKGWEEAPPRPMRLVTFATPGGCECYVSQLAGDGGGMAANLNRWRGQMGLAPLDDAWIAALERVTVLGEEAPLIEMTGTYTAMSGAAQPGARFLGVAAEAGGWMWFVRMTGPDEAVAAQRDAFLAFCRSLTLEEGVSAHETGF
jgi:hypothetical protein